MTGSCTGRVALVTGASQGGTGTVVALRLAAEGAAVAVTARTVEGLEATRRRIEEIGGTCLVLPADLSDPGVRAELVPRTEAALGPVDILVNNAGIPTDGFPQVDFKDSDPALWRRFVDLNLYGVMNCTHTALPGMCERGWGRVITISSEAGRVGLPIRVSLYGAAKAGAIGLMKHVAHEVGPLGVTCNSLALGRMESPTSNPRGNAIPRNGTGRDIGATVAFLASDGGEWITGQVIPVNGGAVTA